MKRVFSLSRRQTTLTDIFNKMSVSTNQNALSGFGMSGNEIKHGVEDVEIVGMRGGERREREAGG